MYLLTAINKKGDVVLTHVVKTNEVSNLILGLIKNTEAISVNVTRLNKEKVNKNFIKNDEFSNLLLPKKSLPLS
jgi:hypothetical protein